KRKKPHVVELQMEEHPNYNKNLTDILAEMGNIEKNRGQIHKFKAYDKAVKALKAYPRKITSVSLEKALLCSIFKQGKEASQLDGIGKKIAAKIDEILA